MVMRVKTLYNRPTGYATSHRCWLMFMAFSNNRVEAYVDHTMESTASE